MSSLQAERAVLQAQVVELHQADAIIKVGTEGAWRGSLCREPVSAFNCPLPFPPHEQARGALHYQLPPPFPPALSGVE